jgi:hypothetical protein
MGKVIRLARRPAPVLVSKQRPSGLATGRTSLASERTDGR